MASTTEIRQLIGDSRIAEAIEQLKEQTKGTYLHNEVIQQSAKFEHYRKVKRNGTERNEDLNLMLNAIQFALLEIIDRIDGGIPKKTSKRNLWQYITAAAVIIGILGSLAEVFNFINIIPNQNQSVTNAVTVIVHGREGIDDKILQNRGIVYLNYGGSRVQEPINNQGEATFQQIPEKFFGADADIKIFVEDPEGEPYRVANPDSTYTLVKEKSIYLQVLLTGMEEINGIVKDFETGKGIDSALVRIFGAETYSDKYGEYLLEIPEDKQRQFITVRAYKEGYQDWELAKIPTTTDQEIVIPMKREK